MQSVISGRHGTDPLAPKLVYSHYDAPEVEVGALVHFYPNCDRKARPLPAEVTAANKSPEVWKDGKLIAEAKPLREISLSVTTPNGLEAYDSVRHIGDPRCNDRNVKHLGAWDFRPPSKFEQKVLQELSDLRARLTSLETELDVKHTPKGK